MIQGQDIFGPQIRISNGWTENDSDFLVRIVDRKYQHGSLHAATLDFKEVPCGQRIQPAMFLNTESVQLLMNDLWIAGVRPAGRYLKILDYDKQNTHLQDMRALVSHFTDCPLPEDKS